MPGATSIDAIAPLHFDTADLPEAECRAVCRAHMAGVAGRIEIDTGDGVLAGSNGIRCALPGLSVITCFFRPVPVHIRHDDSETDDGVIMIRSMEGPLTVRQSGQEVAMAAGEFVFLSGRHAYEWDLPQGGRIDCGRLPAGAFPLPRARLDRILLRPIPKSFPPLQLLITYGAYLLMRGPHSDDEAGMVNGHFKEILPLVVAYLAADTGRDAGKERLQAIKAHIDGHLADPELTVAAIARMHNVTPRSVQKLFQQDETTFSKYLLDRRLAAAKSQIGHPGDERPISTIAYEVGFGDLSYFNRAFRRRFGKSPSEMRRR